MMDAAPKADDSTATRVSKTAIWVAAARAIGAREPDPDVRNPDSLAEKLLGDRADRILEHPIVNALGIDYEEAMLDTEVADTVRAMIERTCFIDAALERAVAEGAKQVLIPGAGMDSHAYRFRDLLESAAVFELDRPETLDYKRHRVDEALGGPPGNLTYVPIDVGQRKMPELLAEQGYDPSKRTFVILEGVTMYLAEDVLRDLFRFVASHAPGSSIVFDFASDAVVAGFANLDIESVPAATRPSIERFLNVFSHEPWLFGFPVGSEREFLADLGLELGEVLVLGSDESTARYLTRSDGTTVGAEAHAKAVAMREAAQNYATAKMSDAEREAYEKAARQRQQQMTYRIAEAVVP